MPTPRLCDLVKAGFPIGLPTPGSLRCKGEKQVIFCGERFDQLIHGVVRNTAIDRHCTQGLEERSKGPPEQRVLGEKTYIDSERDFVHKQPNTVPIRRMRRCC